MKKILFISIVSVASLASCKKDRTCTCTNTSNGVTGTPYETTYKKAKKSDAKVSCISYSYTTTGTSPYAVDVKCELK